MKLGLMVILCNCNYNYIHISHHRPIVFMNVFMVNVAVFRNEKTNPLRWKTQVWNAFKELQHVGALDRAGTSHRPGGKRESGGWDVVSHMGVSNKMGDHRKILSSKCWFNLKATVFLGTGMFGNLLIATESVKKRW